MANTFKLSIVSPEKTVYEGVVESIIAPAQLGYMGVLAHHQPMIVALKPGILEYLNPDGYRSYVVVGGGFMEVGESGAIVLADEAERAEEVDEAKAREALDQARLALKGEASSMTSEQAAAEIEKAMNRIRAARTKVSSS